MIKCGDILMGEIKVFLVEDEMIIRNSIKKSIQWEAEGYHFVGEASDGELAYPMILKERPDILITDIKMPFMDGLELIRRVHERYPEMRIVIFSGFNEFEYAREAMRYNVENYILKPVDPVEFEQTLLRVIKELDDMREEQRRKEKQKSFLLDHVLYSLVNGVKASDLRQKFDESDVFIQAGQWHRMLLFKVNRDFFGRETEETKEQLLQGAVSGCKYLNLNPQQSVLFFKEDSPDWEQIREQIKRYMQKEAPDLRFYLAASEGFKTIEEIGRSFDGMETLMERRFYQRESTLFVPEYEEEFFGCSQEADDTLMKQMKQDIRVKDMDSLWIHYRKLCEKYSEKPLYSQIYVKFIFSNLLKCCYDELPQKTEQDLNNEIERLYRANEFAQVMQIAESALALLEKHFGPAKNNTHPEIETIKQYIYQNYEKELGIDLLAEKVYMAPAYLSTLFKKETGQNLSKFIKAVRMERAKELLEETHRKIVDISTAVGYANVSYFCQSFREYFGISPQKFRSKGEIYEETVEEI